jgi:hypothetical protein
MFPISHQQFVDIGEMIAADCAAPRAAVLLLL